MAIKLVQSFSGKRYVFEFNKTHGTIGFGPETKPLVSTLLREHGFEFVLRSVDWQIPNIQGVTWRILVSRVDWWVIMSRKVPGELVRCVRSEIAHCRRNAMRRHGGHGRVR